MVNMDQKKFEYSLKHNYDRLVQMHWEKQRIIECFSEIGYSIRSKCIKNYNTFEENKLLSHDTIYNP